MRILVTGGAGFIGSHLCDALIAQGHEVWCLDNFMSGRRANVEHLSGNPKFHLIRHDVRRRLRWTGDLDRIYHLACPASPVYYQFDRIETVETAVLGVLEMLRLAERTGARLLYTSSSEVYGDPLEHPQKETYNGNVNPIGPKACYEEGKRIGETLCSDYHEQRGVDIRIVRFFNVYGPRMLFHDGRVVSNFVRQALNGEDVTVHGDGSQTRSFLYIDDAVPALIGVMEQKETGPFNIGNPDERAIKDIAEIVVRESGSKSRIVHVPLKELPGRVGDAMRRCPDTSKLKAALGSAWEPRVGLVGGLRRTIEDFRQRLVHKSRVLVFIPSFYPQVGPAETLVMEMAKRLQDWNFDVVTAKADASLKNEERIGVVQVQRVGLGRAWDKYLLPFLGAVKAKTLSRKEPFEIIWALPVSYGAGAAWLFNLFRLKRVPVLYTGFSLSPKASKGWRAGVWKMLSPRADRAFAEPAESSEFQAKRLQTLFNELEIIGTKR